jgi:hypothetical protein
MTEATDNHADDEIISQHGPLLHELMEELLIVPAERDVAVSIQGGTDGRVSEEFIYLRHSHSSSLCAYQKLKYPARVSRSSLCAQADGSCGEGYCEGYIIICALLVEKTSGGQGYYEYSKKTNDYCQTGRDQKVSCV